MNACACRRPTVATHRADGFTVNLERGFGTYYAARVNPRTDALEYVTVPRTIRNNWQRARDWSAREFARRDACTVADCIATRPDVARLARDLVARRGSAHLAAPGIARALRLDGARDENGKAFTTAHVRAAFRSDLVKL